MNDKDSNAAINEALVQGATHVAAGEEGDAGCCYQRENSSVDQKAYEALLKELNAAQAKLNEQTEVVLRSKAEIENIRKRAADDVRKAHKFRNERFLRELLPVVDSLERCLETKTEDAADLIRTIHQGVELTYQMFLQVFEKVEAEQINPLHENFNPQLHEVIAREEVGDAVKSGSIIKVLQRGYTLSGRLIRPALVVIAK